MATTSEGLPQTNGHAKVETNRDLWVFAAGAIFAAGKHTREELLGMFGGVSDEAPSDVLRLIDALQSKHGSPVRDWLRERGVELGNGNGVFQAIAGRMVQAKRRNMVEKVAQEIHFARHLSIEDFAALLATKLKEMET